MAKTALLVGINAYSGSNKLNGCLNDVHDFHDILTNAGFDSIIMCLDKQATKKAIMHQLAQLIKKADPGDVLVFYFSGHGSRLETRTPGDPRDRLDQVLCPVDADRAATSYIRDKELAALFSQLPENVRLEVVLDCCFSGSGTRDWSVDGNIIKTRCFIHDNPVDYAKMYKPVIKRILHPGFTKDLCQTDINHVLWSASQDNQTASEMSIPDTSGNLSPRGVFTYYLCRSLRNNVTTRKDIEEIVTKEVKKTVKKMNREQTPQLEYAFEWQLKENIFTGRS